MKSGTSVELLETGTSEELQPATVMKSETLVELLETGAFGKLQLATVMKSGTSREVLEQGAEEMPVAGSFGATSKQSCCTPV